MALSKRKVSYFYQDDMDYYYGMHHPMKPFRLKLTHDLILSYRLYRSLRVLRPHPASAEEMMQFHSPEYVKFLQRVTPENQKKLAVRNKPYDSSNDMLRFGIGEQTDCPVFEDMFDFFKAYTGASLDAALALNREEADICINWSGGLHHAKKAESSGFCYINDIVLAILELLKKHPRVLYIDIDIHHGDGVEEAFYSIDRVMTVSFHKYGDFFPGTGNVADVGVDGGKYTSVNFPIKNGMDDLNYEKVFKPIIQEVMDVFRPGAIVLQCGADSLSGDRLCSVTGGCFNLTLDGHAECVKFVKSFGVPTLVLGGGGYTVRNVARCWVNETAVLLDKEIDDNIPQSCKYLRYFVPNFKLTLPVGNAQNLNTEAELNANRIQVLENLRQLKGAPSVQMSTVPPAWAIDRAERQATLKDEQDPDVRESQRDADERVDHDNELFEGDSDNRGEGPRRVKASSSSDSASASAGGGSKEGASAAEASKEETLDAPAVAADAAADKPVAPELQEELVGDDTPAPPKAAGAAAPEAAAASSTKRKASELGNSDNKQPRVDPDAGTAETATAGTGTTVTEAIDDGAPSSAASGATAP